MNKLSHRKFFVGECASGTKKHIEVYTVSSDNLGEQYYIQANLHGPETTGIPVVYDLISYLQKHLLKGAVTLIPVANPWGIDTKIGGKLIGHANISHEKPQDWNRIFPKVELGNCDFEALIKKDIGKLVLTKEKLLSYTLLSLAIKADVIIDIHSVVNSIKHVYYYPHEKNNVAFFDVPVSIELEYTFGGTFDEAVLHPFLASNTYRSKEVYVLEVTESAAGDQCLVADDTAIILQYLHRKGAIELPQIQITPLQSSESFTIHDKKAIYSPVSGIFFPAVNVGEHINKGQLLGTLLRQRNSIKVNSPYNGKVKNITVNRTLEFGQFMLGLLSKD